MRYGDLSKVFDVYAQGGNVMEYLRKTLGKEANTEMIIAVAYDLQSGSYTKNFEKNIDSILHYIDEISVILKSCTTGAQTVLEVGTGECTTLAGIVATCFYDMTQVLGCDISWSRLYRGIDFRSRTFTQRKRTSLELVCVHFFRFAPKEQEYRRRLDFACC